MWMISSSVALDSGCLVDVSSRRASLFPLAQTIAPRPAPVRASRAPMKQSLAIREADLLKGAAGGDHEAFSEFYDLLAPRLYPLVLRIIGDADEAQDVLQESFVKMWEKASSFDPARSAAFTWAVMITRNKSIDRLRARGRAGKLVEAATMATIPGDDVDEKSAALVDQIDEWVLARKAVNDLPEDERHVLNLAFFDGLSHSEISNELGEPLGTIKSRARRGLKRLRDALEELLS